MKRLTFFLVAFTLSYGELVRTAPVAWGCAGNIDALERRWGGTGAWRPLAPFPVLREASPTDSVGVWLERWRLENGAVQLRRISAGETVAATFDGSACVVRFIKHRRVYDAAALQHAFTDERLRALLNTSRRGIIYVWSPRMPLSVRGLSDARAAARTLQVDFTSVVAEASPAELEAGRVGAADQQTLDAFELVYRDATLHYPSILFYQGGVIVGSAIPGYKSQQTYEVLGREHLETGAITSHLRTWPMLADDTRLWVDRNAQVTTHSVTPTPRRIGFFFKPVAGTRLVAYAASDTSFLYDLGTRVERRIPGGADPVPTPDGLFVMRPGLAFHGTDALRAGDTAAALVDPRLPDEYESASVLTTDRTATRYRVTTGWQMGIRLREYEVLRRGVARVIIEPVGEPAMPCVTRRLSLPISAKRGREVGVFDTRSGTSRVVEVTADRQCVDRLDLGFAAGKLAFSYDGQAIAFATSRINVDAEGSLMKPEDTFYKDAFVLYRETGRLVSLSRNRPLAGMTFPEFLPDGRVVVLDHSAHGHSNDTIRVVEIR